jgi:Putative Flp pilus-assembly TadE/G-like
VAGGTITNGTTPKTRIQRAENGQAILLVVVALALFMLGSLGLGIDGAQMYAHRQMAQTAADAAAQAAMMSILRGTNSTSTHPFSTGASFTCTVPPQSLDLRTPCVYAQNNGFGTSADTVTVSFPTTISGVTLASKPTPAVSVTVQRTLATSLSRFLGSTSWTVKAKATSGMIGGVSSNCLYVLDPSAQNAFTANNGAAVTMNCGIVVNSSNSDAATITGGATVTSTTTSIVGNYAVNNGGSISPAPTTGAASVTDPFGSVIGPTAGTCATYPSGYGTYMNQTFNPGTYCSGITVGNGASVTFNPGTYIINGGGVSFQGGTTISGSGVMFYLTGTNATYGSANIANGATVTLSAETSGTYQGLLFFQDRSITSSTGAIFAGGSSTNLTGSLYFPTTSVSFSNGSSSSGNTAILAKQVSFTGGTRLVYDSTGLKTGLGTATTVGLIE